MSFSIWATKVDGIQHDIPTSEWMCFESEYNTKSQALARCRVLIKPEKWEPRVFVVKDEATGAAVSKFYTNRPELLQYVTKTHD